MQFTVYGEAKPQGSKRGLIRKGRVLLVESCKKLKPWRQEVAATAEAYMWHDGGIKIPRPHPVRLDVLFIFERPKSTKRAAYKVTKPDFDKLLRGIADALTGIMYDDDSQIVRCSMGKTYGSPARTMIRISRFEGSNEEMDF